MGPSGRDKTRDKPGKNAGKDPNAPKSSKRPSVPIRRPSSDTTRIVPSAILSSLSKAAAESGRESKEDASYPSFPSKASVSHVATKEQGVAAVRELYAKGDIAGALALAAKLVPDEPSVESSLEVDVSLSGLAADAPRSELEVDVSLTGLESVAHGSGAADSTARVHVDVPKLNVDKGLLAKAAGFAFAPASPKVPKVLADEEEPTAPSLPNLSNIIDDIESAEPTIQFRRKPLQPMLLAQQRRMAKELGPEIAPLVAMPNSAPAEVPDVLTAEPPSPALRPNHSLLLPPPPAVLLNLSQEERQSIPRLLKSRSELAQLPLGPRGGFILAQIDGKQNLEEILDVCAMAPGEAVEIIRHLQALGAIELD